MKQSHSTKADCRSGGVLWNYKFHYEIHKSPALDRILSQF